MLLTLFILSTLTFCTLTLTAILGFFFRPHLTVQKRIEVFLGQSLSEHQTAKQKPAILQSKFSLWWSKLESTLDPKLSKEGKKDLDRKLTEAGRPFNWKSADFRLVQILLAIVFTIFVLILFGQQTEKFGSFLIIIFCSVSLGIYFPTFYLSKRRARRIELIQKELSDFFDTVNLTIEAGVGLDAALKRVANNREGPLAEEFRRLLEDIKLGKSRREAFIDLRNRVPLDSFQSIMTSLIQADQLGIGIAKALRSLTVRIREQQLQLAREKGMKAPVKMLFPMVLFIFPAMFIVILGPLIIQIFSGTLSL